MNFLLSLLLINLSASGTSPIPALQLMVGEQHKIKSVFQTATLTNPSVVALTKTKGGYVLIGKKPGEGFLKLGNGASQKIIVYSAKLELPKKEVDLIITDAPDLSVEMTPLKIKIGGAISKVDEWTSMVSVMHSYPKLIDWQPQATDEVLLVIKNKIGQEFKSRGIFSASVEIKNQTLRIYGSSKSPSDIQTVQEISKEWGLPAPEATSAVELRPMVEIEITIAEVKRNSFKSLGLVLPGSYSATILPSPTLGSFDTQYNPLNILFKAQSDQQMGKVIANPKLLCRSGEVAHFIAGGEIPIKVMNWKTADVIWKKYGVLLDITPVADLLNGISTKLVTEISLIDEAHKVDNIPGFLTNRIDTHFDLRGEKTIVLSGLIKNEIGRGSTETPLLSSIPILGELFKSRDYKDNKTELIVLVTPRVVSPDGPPGPPPNEFWKNDL